MPSGHAAVHHLTPFGSNLFPHEASTGDRRLVIRLDVYEPVGLVQRLRFAHVRQRVKPELRILQTPALVAQPRDQPARQAAAARLGTDVEPLHFSDGAVERPERDHPEMPIALDGDEQRAARRGIVTGQPAELLLNLLKGEVKADPLDVFAKHLPHMGNIGTNGRTDLQDFQPRPLDYSLCVVSLAELTLPMLIVAAADEPAADPELVRLVTLARTGDRAAFGRLIERHLTAARRVALAAVGQPSDADEAVQEASVAAWRRLEGLNDPNAFRGWFLRIVWRKAIDRRRSLRSWFDRICRR